LRLVGEPPSRVVGLTRQGKNEKSWRTARQIAEALGDLGLTAHDVAGAIRAKLIPRYVKRREDPDDRGIIPPRYQYQRTQGEPHSRVVGLTAWRVFQAIPKLGDCPADS